MKHFIVFKGKSDHPELASFMTLLWTACFLGSLFKHSSFAQIDTIIKTCTEFKGLNNKSENDYSTVVTSLDAPNAFDKVPQKGILSVLLYLHKSGQMPLYIVLYYKNFLEGRTFRVQQGDHICEEIGELKANS